MFKIKFYSMVGMARPSFHKVMKHLIKRHKPQIVVLLETRTIAVHAKELVFTLSRSGKLLWGYVYSVE